MKKVSSHVNLHGIFIFGVVIIILIFSWLPNPSFKNIPFFPRWLVQFTDTFGRERTAIPYILLGALLFNKPRKINYTIGLYLLILIISLFSELVQLFLPKRVFDLYDILWALIGSAFGHIVLVLVNKLIEHE